MKEKLHIARQFFTLFALLLLSFGITAVRVNAAEYSASVSTNRQTGECTYTIQGLDIEKTNTLTLQVSHKDTKQTAYEKSETLTSTNCANGTFTGSFSLDNLNYAYDEYTVTLIAGDEKVSAGTCDFAVHADKLSLNIGTEEGAAARTASVVSTESTGSTAVPGTGSQVTVFAWQEGTDESTAKAISTKTPFVEGGMNLAVNVSQAGTAYGKWNAKLVLEHDKAGKSVTLAKASYSVNPTQTSFVIQKTTALEKKKAFAISLNGLKNAYGIKKVTFYVYNSKGKKAATVTGTKKKSDGSKYYAEVTLKKLNYSLDIYTVKAVLTDNNGKNQTLNTAATADERVSGGTLSVTKKNNATCIYRLSNAYIPGNIKKVRFVLYQIKGSKQKKAGTYETTATSGKSISVRVHNEDMGRFKLCVYGYTNWGKKVFLNEETYRLYKKHLGKNGWFYEKYAGKKYKFYYVNNIKQTDLTQIMNLKKSSSTNTNRLYIEVNRAASNVTIYHYNEETKKYDIPIKTCAVSVGADTWTNAGTSGLNENSSYTPLGTYSVCTNGTSVKYTLKPMHEPDGSTLYARWTTHIVGNVYFHSIAVGAQSHYALPYYTYNRLGTPCSAGCIRMTVADAKWIYDYASTGTTVKINKGNSKKPGPLGKGSVIKTTAGINYDPTDPGVPDSRKKKDYKAKKITGYMTKSGKRVGY